MIHFSGDDNHGATTLGAEQRKRDDHHAALRNDSYVMSACGGKVMTTFMPPPLASSYLAFHPQDNNIIVIGMDDWTIHIYNMKTKLKGHSKRITGLAFSSALNILVSHLALISSP